MPKLFGVDIAKEVHKAAAKGLLPATLTKVTPGTRTPGALGGGTNPTTTTYAVRGFVEDFDTRMIDGTIITAKDRKVTILGHGLTVEPAPQDKITIESKTYQVVHVKRDPAAATYTLHVRGL